LEVARLGAFLRAHPKVALDTCIFIYQFEANPQYSPLTDRIFRALDQSDIVAVTSTVTMAELLVHPYRDHDPRKADNLLGLLSTYPNLDWIAPDLEIASGAAKIRAQNRLSSPDAIQAATAINVRASALFTNDPVFRRVTNLEALLLDDYI
jgi:predicted nucleic acid-binding protein